MNDVADRLVELARSAGVLLLEQRLMLVTAESCTGGGIAFAVTQIPGSSSWFDRGMVVYSNDAKQRMLGVSTVYLRDFGAVSEPVAREMALGGLQHSAAQVAVAVTGIAGPDGGTQEKPVGTVCFAWALRRDASGVPWVRTRTAHFEGNRAAVRTDSIIVSLEELCRLLRHREDEKAPGP